MVERRWGEGGGWRGEVSERKWMCVGVSFVCRAENGIRCVVWSRGLGDVDKRQVCVVLCVLCAMCVVCCVLCVVCCVLCVVCCVCAVCFTLLTLSTKRIV